MGLCCFTCVYESCGCCCIMVFIREISVKFFDTCSWSVYCGDANSRYGRRYQTGFAMRDAADSSSYSGYEKDFMKQTMLEHEAVFKNQVMYLHS